MADESSVVTAVSEQRTPESSLLDHVERVAHSRSGRFAVVLHLSELRPHNRQPHHIRIASRTFDTLLNSADTQLYTLTLGDLVLMCKDARVDDVDLVIDKIRALFRNDPLTASSRGGALDKFSSWYDFEIDYDSFLQVVLEYSQNTDGDLAVSEDASAGRGAGAGFLGQALDPFSLAKVNDSLNRTRIEELVYHQPAVVIGGDGTERILFRENFVSIGELQRRIAPGFNIVSNVWLFQHLTQTIDRRLLSMLSKEDFSSLQDAISINLNVSTVLSKDFQRFDGVVAEHTNRVVVEMQQIDVFSDLDEFKSARTWLLDRGYRVLLDGLTPMSLNYYNPGLLDADLFKVSWGVEFTETESIEDHADMAEMVENIGADRFILGRTDSEDALRWALGLGIRRFQGYYIDDLVTRQLAKDGNIPAARKSSGAS